MVLASAGGVRNHCLDTLMPALVREAYHIYISFAPSMKNLTVLSWRKKDIHPPCLDYRISFDKLLQSFILLGIVICFIS